MGLSLDATLAIEAMTVDRSRNQAIGTLLPMQERIHNYVVAGEGTAQEALDGLVADWVEVFEDEGKL